MNAVKCVVFFSLICPGISLAGATEATHVYEMVEVSFSAAKTYENPYLDVDLWIDLEGPDNI